MHINEGRISLLQREILVAVAVFTITALFFISLSVFARTVGTNIDSTGTTGAATSTPWGDLAVDQVAGKGSLRPVFVVGDNGTSTPSRHSPPRRVRLIQSIVRLSDTSRVPVIDTADHGLNLLPA